MNEHTYLTRINDKTWMDLNRIKEVQNKSINTLLNEGARMIRDAEMQKIVQQRKTRTSLQSISGW